MSFCTRFAAEIFMNSSKGEFYRLIKEEAEASPYYGLMGMKVMEVSDGYASVRLPFRRDLTQMFGTVHGGAIVSVADAAMGIALRTQLGKDAKVATIELKINFIAPVQGKDLLAKGKISHKGSRIAVVEVEVVDGEARLVAKGLATFFLFG